MKLYLPGKGESFSYPRLGPALTRPIRPEIIENNYDLMIKYATAIRQGTASTEALLRRFQGETTHPAYTAMLELGRAQRTIFLAHWLRNRDLQRETESGLNVVENYNGVNDYIRFGKRGELASNHREEQELGMLCLQILQSCLAFINTLMIQDTLAQPEWAHTLTDVDRRGLTPLFHSNMTPTGSCACAPINAWTCPSHRPHRHDQRRSTRAGSQSDPGQTQGTSARQVPTLRTPRLRLPQRGVPAPARRARRRGHHRPRQAALCAHRGRDPPLLPDGVDRTAKRRHRADQNLALHRCPRRRARRYPYQRGRPGHLPHPHHPGQSGKDRYVPFPTSFKETLALHIAGAQDKRAAFLFESSWKKPYSTRGVPCSPATPPRPG
jgi:hypothetical protein